MKIAILGSRGIPNKYGGFEQFAEYVSVGMVNSGHEVTVYSPHFHEYKKNRFKGVHIIHKKCFESKLGSSAHFFYDYICLKDALQKDYDIILELGYQSVAISYLLLPIKKSIIVTNMDGLEWKRDKWSPLVKKITKWFEKLGAEKSHYLVSDNKGIKDYLFNAYGKVSDMIPYGAEVFSTPTLEDLKVYGLHPHKYFVLIARLEPENNIEAVLDGYIKSNSTYKFIVIGNSNTAYGSTLKEKYIDSGVNFIGGVYNINILNNIRFHAKAYFHGHSVGGTNPSLLEAMASSAFIVAHDNIFNTSVLNDSAVYFKNKDDIASILTRIEQGDFERKNMINKNIQKIENIYSWSLITSQYLELFERALYENSNNYSG